MTNIYTWDGQGRLTAVKNLAGTTIASYTYHADGLRKSKTVGATTYYYHYNGTNLIYITNASGSTLWSFTWDGGKPISLTNWAGTTYYYITNYHGDVVRIVDATGNTVASYSYDPWGKVLSESENAAVDNQPLHYAGYVYDADTQLYYLQARYYDAETARFISRDPDGGDQDEPLTQNLYVYCNDDPVNLVDPDGEWALMALGAVWGGYKAYKSAKRSGHSGWGLFGRTLGGAALGALSWAGGGVFAASKAARIAYGLTKGNQLRKGIKAHKVWSKVMKFSVGGKYGKSLRGNFRHKPDAQWFGGRISGELKTRADYASRRTMRQIQRYRNNGARIVLRFRY